ncbi:MAG: pyridoxal 5'-phosphate synthase glutaminase subunit PdxT [Dehalococcoidales bacterium]|jgi:5'-phosphate synthase pdxT subunit|nr:pyridoxal 5'-phosphate synthase glutaminase subunit PdxT [Dehalococcoidales bacterium]MDD3994463.1 pyridoxal 5'-phosphate synthase glutaminase subunit PdxT [Dehalococcoidales bacterium]NLT28558.1 pyridoxal 5'-phosphate synthase glutaminase subunit PdxT [Dehalococcoidales bacterium]
MNIGLLALQGAFIEHASVLKQLGVESKQIRKPAELKGLDGLIIPGGESTTMLNLANNYELIEPLRKMGLDGFPMMGTCAGMILLAKTVTNSDIQTLGLMDIKVMRNAFGRQPDSFETDLAIKALGEKPFHSVFIRAPLIEEANDNVEILAKLDSGTIVAVRQNNLLGMSFHPELADDNRMHEYFLKMVTGNI